ncbi:G protein-coupled glucose receptor regulating Gpa2-domain-containing protein [Cercophora scortea]|uniref:G protein-coupled glucose receptor regulating Gpa2-domain-containing protein n=1 Tax=Cercophora scortea TaxID=314031 RepID=A0AAE0M8S4_9PEZI|nr:G protein-coupled glucose receptor regulating Gpa2-domain-containing protein [Cercophora scortea]
MSDHDGHGSLSAESDNLNPLPLAHRQGLTAVSTLAAISFVSTLTVFVFLTYKLIRWHIKTRRDAGRESLDPGVAPVDLSLGLAQRHFTRHSTIDARGRIATRKPVYPNQFLVLIYNLMLADLHQAAAFLLNAVWIRTDSIKVKTPTCFAQGWLISTGDLASSWFIAAIAIHTYLTVVRHYKPPQWALYSVIVFLWFLDYLFAALGPVTTYNGREWGGFYARADAWCWVNIKFDMARFFLHYMFIFIALSVTSILYTLIFFTLRKERHANHPQHTTATTTDPENDGALPLSLPPPACSRGIKRRNTTNSTARRAAVAKANSGGQHMAFLLYPVIYVVCTAPLAIMRICTMAEVAVPVTWYCTAGALIASNGWLDVLLWGLSRTNLLFNSDVGSEDTGLETFSFMRTPPGRKYGNIVYVEGAARCGRDKEGGSVCGYKGAVEWLVQRLWSCPRLSLGRRGFWSLGAGTGAWTVSETVSREPRQRNKMAIQMDIMTSVVIERKTTKEKDEVSQWDRLRNNEMGGVLGESTIDLPEFLTSKEILDDLDKDLGSIEPV